jgi:hypothetical protein
MVALSKMTMAMASGGSGGSTSWLLPAWAFRLSEALSAYAGCFAAGALCVALVRRSPSLRDTPVAQFMCFDRPPPGSEADHAEHKIGRKPAASEATASYAKLLFATVGIYTTLISQGLIQERLMTQDYSGARFTSSAYAIGCTRILASVVAHVARSCRTQAAPGHRAAFYKFSYSSLANVVSSWCQYESLKHTSYPVVTLAKSAKTIPVMMMGRLLHGRRHSWADYGTASLVVAGVCGFAMVTSGGGGGGSNPGGVQTSASGVALLSLYLCFDAFQSQWQSGLFKREKVGQVRRCFHIRPDFSYYADPPRPILCPSPLLPGHLPRASIEVALEKVVPVGAQRADPCAMAML